MSARDVVTYDASARIATVTLNRQVFADVGMSDEQARALVDAVETLRRHAGDF